MAGRGGPSFLKRQKEQTRAARAIAKRSAQQTRRRDKAAGILKVDDLGEPLPTETDEQNRPTEDEAPA